MVPKVSEFLEMEHRKIEPKSIGSPAEPSGVIQKRAAFAHRPLEPVVSQRLFCRPVRGHRQRLFCGQSRSKRSNSITLFHATTKSRTNFPRPSSHA